MKNPTKWLIFSLITLMTFLPLSPTFAASVSDRLQGRILLQVESKGEAWYVNPNDGNRYSLGKPSDALKVIKELGLGISNQNFEQFNLFGAPNSLAGKILLKVEDRGQGYYVHPETLKLHSLGKAEEALAVMRQVGLGISNADLNQIPVNENHYLESLLNEIAELKRQIDELKQVQQQILARETPAPIVVSDTNNGTENSLGEVIQEWRPGVAFIRCAWRTVVGSLYYKTGSGLFVKNGENFILTNKHVIVEQNLAPAFCEFKVPGDSGFVTVQNDNTNFKQINGLDIGFIKVNSLSSHLQALNSPFKQCTERAAPGDKILILGYPSIGTSEDITVTDGIISGYEQGHYVTSAKIEQGNSGGIAIHVENSCNLGIPTFVKVGNVESLGRILDLNGIVDLGQPLNL